MYAPWLKTLMTGEPGRAIPHTLNPIIAFQSNLQQPSHPACTFSGTPLESAAHTECCCCR